MQLSSFQKSLTWLEENRLPRQPLPQPPASAIGFISNSKIIVFFSTKATTPLGDEKLLWASIRRAGRIFWFSKSSKNNWSGNIFFTRSVCFSHGAIMWEGDTAKTERGARPHRKSTAKRNNNPRLRLVGNSTKPLFMKVHQKLSSATRPQPRTRQRPRVSFSRTGLSGSTIKPLITRLFHCQPPSLDQHANIGGIGVGKGCGREWQISYDDVFGCGFSFNALDQRLDEPATLGARHSSEVRGVQGRWFQALPSHSSASSGVRKRILNNRAVSAVHD